MNKLEFKNMCLKYEHITQRDFDISMMTPTDFLKNKIVAEAFFVDAKIRSLSEQCNSVYESQQEIFMKEHEITNKKDVLMVDKYRILWEDSKELKEYHKLIQEGKF